MCFSVCVLIGSFEAAATFLLFSVAVENSIHVSERNQRIFLYVFLSLVYFHNHIHTHNDKCRWRLTIAALIYVHVPMNDSFSQFSFLCLKMLNYASNRRWQMSESSFCNRSTALNKFCKRKWKRIRQRSSSRTCSCEQRVINMFLSDSSDAIQWSFLILLNKRITIYILT